jgi:hypothetical protein
MTPIPIGAIIMPLGVASPIHVRASVIDRFGKLAMAPDQERRFPVGPENASRLGYDVAELDAPPTSFTESFCGVGNLILLGEPKPGQSAQYILLTKLMEKVAIPAIPGSRNTGVSSSDASGT